MELREVLRNWKGGGANPQFLIYRISAHENQAHTKQMAHKKIT